MKLSAILEPLLRAGVDPEVILDAVRAFESEQDAAAEGGKEKARARWRKWKDAQTQTNVGKRLQPLANDSREGVTRVEDISSTNKITGKEESKEERAPAAPSPRSELETVLDAEHSQAVVDHRQRLRKPLTAYAAKQLAAKFAKFPDPNAAADRMIESGWLKIEPHWGQDAPQRQSQGPPPKQTVGQQARDELKRMGLLNAPDEITRHENGGNGSPDFAGSGIARRIAFSPGGRGGH